MALAHLLAEDRCPPESLWNQTLISSRLLEYELWTRIHARGLTATHGDQVRILVSGVAFLELVPPVLARALDPFPVPLRTLDALHLASIVFLQKSGQRVQVASYDERLRVAAQSMSIPLLLL